MRTALNITEVHAYANLVLTYIRISYLCTELAAGVQLRGLRGAQPRLPSAEHLRHGHGRERQGARPGPAAPLPRRGLRGQVREYERQA